MKPGACGAAKLATVVTGSWFRRVRYAGKYAAALKHVPDPARRRRAFSGLHLHGQVAKATPLPPPLLPPLLAGVDYYSISLHKAPRIPLLPRGLRRPFAADPDVRDQGRGHAACKPCGQQAAQPGFGMSPCWSTNSRSVPSQGLRVLCINGRLRART